MAAAQRQTARLEREQEEEKMLEQAAVEFEAADGAVDFEYNPLEGSQGGFEDGEQHFDMSPGKRNEDSEGTADSLYFLN